MPDDISPERAEQIRRRVNRAVRHVADPAKRARLVRSLTRILSQLARIDRAIGVSDDAD